MDVYEELIRERAAGRSCALATIVNVVGSIPSYNSAKMLVKADGAIVGTIGGGPAEAEVLQVALQVIKGGKPRMISFHLHERPEVDSGMVCGGSLDVYVEPIRPAPVAYLFGAGHVGVVTARAARLAGFEIEIADDRASFANAQRFPEARAIHVGPMAEVMAGMHPNDQALIFIATRCHEMDGEVLTWACGTPAGYVGMIGSRRKVLTVFNRLKADGVAPERLARVHAPVGLAIGAETPEEIAISVVAEMIAHVRGAAAQVPALSRPAEAAAAA